jgi:hypothetical protein
MQRGTWDATASPALGHGNSAGHPAARSVFAGVIAGALDLMFALSAWGYLGVPPATIAKSIASGLLGPAAFAGGLGTVAIGVVLHFCMAITMAGAFIASYRHLAVLRRYPLSAGVFYGVGLYLLMSLVVVPLSRAPLTPPPLPMAAADLLAHVLLVGMPIALVARRAGGAQ